MTATIPIVICVVSLCFIIAFIVIFVLAFKKNKKKLEEKLKERGDDGEKKRIVQGPGMPAIDPECQKTETDEEEKKSKTHSQPKSNSKKSYSSVKNELETPPSTKGGSQHEIYNQNSKTLSRKPSAVETVTASEAASKPGTSGMDQEIDLTSDHDSKKSAKKKQSKDEGGTKTQDKE